MAVRELALDRLAEDLQPGTLINPAIKLAAVIQLSEKLELLMGRATQRTETSQNIAAAEATRERLMEALDQIAAKRAKFAHQIQVSHDLRAAGELEAAWARESVGEDDTVDEDEGDGEPTG